MNRLAAEQSAYLRHAANQKINWYPWGEEAFDKAREENKPVFLSSGAIWCHWCHVMAKESFEDEEVAEILNSEYVAVKLDRDERPDIDRRYQKALAGMGFPGGWPLSMFLTADKKPFYGGTYFPPLEMYGRPSFKALLVAISRLYRENRDEVERQSSQLLESLGESRASTGPIEEGMLEAAAGSILSSADSRHGGFGSAPKFAMSGAIEFLIGRYYLSRDRKIGDQLRLTLGAMARGGFYDHLGGGFHRYSTDELWVIPHFEKMADDNAWLLRNYLDAYRLFGDESYRRVAEEIIAFTDKELSHPEGGFYASMDADVTPDDEGGYFTWTEKDFREVLDEEEFRVLSLHFLHPQGAMRHDPGKNVLFSPDTPEATAQKAGLSPGKVEAILEKGKKKLLEARQKRVKPFVDEAVYTSLNGMYVSAYVKAYRTLGDEDVLRRAVMTLERVLRLNLDEGGRLHHIPGIRAILDDYAYIIDALVSVYEVTGEPDHLVRARNLMDYCIEHLWDPEGSGFFDTEERVIGMRLKGVEDIPHPSANAAAIIDLLKLSLISGDGRYGQYAEAALKGFSRQANVMGVHGGYFFCALDAFFNMAELSVHSPPGSPLAREVLALFYPYTAVSYKGNAEGYVVPCVRNICHEPQRSAEGLEMILCRSENR